MATALHGIEELIAMSPERRARIAGTRISVAWIASLAAEPLTPQEIVDDVFGGDISLAQVHAALAFYHRNKVAIDEENDRLDAVYEREAAASTWIPPLSE